MVYDLTEIDGCKKNICFKGADCIDILWHRLLPKQAAYDYICGECPAGLRGNGVSCTSEYLVISLVPSMEYSRKTRLIKLSVCYSATLLSRPLLFRIPC